MEEQQITNADFMMKTVMLKLALEKGKSKAAEGKGKKKQQKKDKDAPKKGMSAYMLWMNNAGRGAAKEALGSGAGIGEIGKWCGAKWKEMDSEARAEWDEKAREDKERYEAEMAAYKAKARQEAAAAASDSESSAEQEEEE